MVSASNRPSEDIFYQNAETAYSMVKHDNMQEQARTYAINALAVAVNRLANVLYEVNVDRS